MEGVRDGGTPPPAKAETSARRWRFGPAVLDERTLELSVAGELMTIERKPLEVLLFLLNHAGEVVTKDEILDAVWPGRVLSESVLTKAVAKLREALKDESQELIRTQHGYGYRLAAKVEVEASTTPPPPRFDFKSGDHPPNRPNWSFVERLGTGGHGEVWLARHDKTKEERVYKFALDETSWASLKREITVSRLLHDTLGERGSAFLRVLDWNLDQPPYSIETEHTSGGSLVKWAAAQGGLTQVPLATRLDIAIQIAEALATAHSAGVLHKDLKPSNVLIEAKGSAPPRVRLCDFGSGGVLDPKRLEAMGITRMGFTQTTTTEGTTSGTPVYFAPEIITGQVFTKQTDIYAMGVVLYQLIAGDLKKPLAPGWEHDVEDSLLREDIGLAAAGNALLRFKEAAELVERLKNLEVRRSRVAASPRATRPAARRHGLLVSAITAGIVALGILAWSRFHAIEATPRSIAILPFTNLSGAEDEYFSETMSRELRGGLDPIEGLRLTPAALAETAGAGQDARIAGRKLKVEAVLTGTLKRNADRLEVSANLIRVDDGKALWSKNYEGPLQEVFAIQEDIAQAVVQEFGIRVDHAPLVHQGTSNVVAYGAYLKAASEVDAQRRIDLLQQAATLDPQFAQPQIALAYAYISRVNYTAPEDQAALKSGFSAAERALAIDPQLAEAHVARGTLLVAATNHFAYEPAAREFKRALALNPRLPVAWKQLASVYLYVGLFDEAQRCMQKFEDLDSSDEARFGSAAVLIWQGKYEEGLEAIERVPRNLNASAWYWHSTWALLALGRLAEADARIEEFFKSETDAGGLIASRRALLRALRGETALAQQDIRTAQNADRNFFYFSRTAYGIASAYSVMNQRTEAIRWLEVALKPDGSFPNYPIPQRDPNLDHLRNEPGFLQIMDRARRNWEHFQELARSG